MGRIASSGDTWSRLAHSNSTSPVAMFNSTRDQKNSIVQNTSLTLEDRVNDPLLVVARPICREVSWNRLVDLDQCCLSISSPELMFIADLVSACSELADRFVVLIQEGNMAMAVSVVWIVV